MATYEILTDHLSIGDKGDLVDSAVIGDGTGKQLEKAGRLRQVTADEVRQRLEKQKADAQTGNKPAGGK